MQDGSNNVINDSVTQSCNNLAIKLPCDSCKTSEQLLTDHPSYHVKQPK